VRSFLLGGKNSQAYGPTPQVLRWDDLEDSIEEDVYLGMKDILLNIFSSGAGKFTSSELIAADPPLGTITYWNSL
jgi:hypothetical protein